MPSSLGQMEFKRVPCHILHGNTWHKHVVLLVRIHFAIFPVDLFLTIALL